VASLIKRLRDRAASWVDSEPAAALDREAADALQGALEALIMFAGSLEKMKGVGDNDDIRLSVGRRMLDTHLIEFYQDASKAVDAIRGYVPPETD